jgi:hypothetical protein
MTSYLVAGDDAAAFAGRVRASLDPVASGLGVREVRQASLAASKGATDFGTYFVYFSFFLVVSALLLAALFFKLGVEQRVREVGLLRAVGFEPADVRRLFLGEGLLLSIAGSALGVLGALGYGALLMHALRTWWVAAVGTTSLTLHVTAGSLVTGAVGGVASAVICIWWTLRSLGRISERSLLAGDISSGEAASVSGAPFPSTVRHEAGPHASTVRHEAGPHVPRRATIAPIVLAVAGAALLLAGAAGWIDPAGAFFGAGFALLGAGLAACLVLFRRQARATLHGRTRQALARLGFRSAAYRPGRSVLSMSVIAAATFILISVDAFRRDASVADTDRRSGVGGYSLIVNTLLPVAHDPNTPGGRDALNLFDLDDSARFEPFRLRPGDDASCLNLYEPRNPRILAPRDGFLEQGRFTFAESLAATPAERGNPWLLLERQEPDGVVPVIADANSMTYVLHRALARRSSSRTRAVRYGCGSWPRCATASSRASCSCRSRTFCGCSRSSAAISSSSSSRRQGRPCGSSSRSRTGSPTSGPTPSWPPIVWPSSIASRTPTCRPSRHSEVSGSCSGLLVWLRSCFATCSSADASSRCSARWGSGGRTSVR